MKLQRASLFRGPAGRALLILCAAAILRISYYLLIRETACLDINLDPISDMEAFHRWALSIVSGDWLGRADFHPFHPWQTAVASPERWAEWYGHVFHQEPFYPYFVAALYLLASPGPIVVIFAQMAMGAAGCSMIYLAARRLAPEGAALCAGILAVLYGPFLYYESLVLRDSFMIPLTACLIWLLCEARARPGRGAARAWWLAAGLVMGVSYVTKASILPFFLCLVALMMFEQVRVSRRDARDFAPLALLVAGVAIVIAPVILRNIVVGAPMMKITTRGPIEFINGNNRWHQGIGWFDGDDPRVSAYASQTLSRAGGRLAPTMGIVLSDWKNDPSGWVRLQARKLAYFFAPFEMPNNASYAWFRLNSPLLRWCLLSFFWISPLALVGLVESWRRRRDYLLLYVYLAAGVALTVVFYVIARFRAPFMPVILVFAGLGLWSIVDHVRRGRLARFSLSVVLIAGTFAVNHLCDYRDRDLVRPQDYLIAIEGYRQRGNVTRALEEAEQGREHFPAFPVFHKEAALLYLRLGRSGEAAAAFTELLARDPQDADARRELMKLGPAPP